VWVLRPEQPTTVVLELEWELKCMWPRAVVWEVLAVLVQLEKHRWPR